MDPENNEAVQNINRDDKRLESLSNKVKETSQQRDAEAQARKEEETKRQEAEKERDFYKGFAGATTKYAAASEHVEDIKAKVMSGYSVEDATVAVLNAQGKLVAAPPPPPPPPPPAAGGSATITLPDGGSKGIGELTRNEKRAALMEAEKRGDISV